MNNFSEIENRIAGYDKNSEISIVSRVLHSNQKIILWNINNNCNMKCHYCNVPYSATDTTSALCIDEMGSAFNELPYEILLLISGGEPFIFKNFIELLKQITRKHYVNINTNMVSDTLYDFGNSIDPEKVTGIHCSVHIEERLKRVGGIEDFVKKYLFLKSKGFRIFASYVAHPRLLDNIDSHFSLLKSNGIDKITSKLFIGTFEGKHYPAAYTAGELALLKKHNEIIVDVDFCNLPESFTKRKCGSGSNYYYMDPDGNLFPCLSLKTPLGNLFQGTMKESPEIFYCPVKSSMCNFECVLLSSNIKKKNFISRFL
jgi:MoaA/NifB/PqqE/SkfB family radical SAM enzyme